MRPSRQWIPYVRVVEMLLLIIALAVAIPRITSILMSPNILSYDDFVVYWATGRLNARGQNPYDPERLLDLERTAGRPLEDALVMWNPPWTVALMMPLGLLPYPIARTLWFVLHFIALAWAFDRLGSLSPGPPSNRWLSLLTSFIFQPILLALKVGQITPLILVGLIGVLTFFPTRPFLAGLFGALLMVKPHLTHLFFNPFLFRVWKCHQWKFLASMGVALAGATAIAMAINPNILGQYCSTWFRGDAPIWQATPTIGGILRYFLGPERTILQWIVPALGVIWLLADIGRRPSWWLTGESMALLTVVSPVIAVYVWMHDIGVALGGADPCDSCTGSATAECEAGGVYRRFWPH